MKTSTEYSKNYKNRIKSQCFALYDSRCSRCGFSDLRALQLDHKLVKPNGPKGSYERGGTGVYLGIIRGLLKKENYQCLCANCNWIKRAETPHENGIKPNVLPIEKRKKLGEIKEEIRSINQLEQDITLFEWNVNK